VSKPLPKSTTYTIKTPETRVNNIKHYSKNPEHIAKNPFHKVLSSSALQWWRVYGNNSDDGNGAGSSESSKCNLVTRAGGLASAAEANHRSFF
jgi:hypothetical protein